MCLAIKKYGFQVTTRLPKRFSEGYGLSEKIIDEISDGVVLTVDNGIAAISAIQKAKDKGLVVIVTDHHLAPLDQVTKQPVLPAADVIVDPSIEDASEFHDYCGAAIAYRFARELLPDLQLIDLLVLASIATVSDVMPLRGANHTLVRDGLHYMNNGRGVPGLRAILEQLYMTSHVTEDDYGFKLGPIFNAVGRLYDNGASVVLDTLLSRKDNPTLKAKVISLIRVNDRRKAILNASMEKTFSILDNERPIVVYDEDFGEGIIGLIAGRLCEQYRCPVVVFTKTESGILKGSGRSIPEINLKDALDRISDVLLGYGGHAGAAGLAILPENLEAFKTAFKASCGNIPEFDPNVYYDLDIEKAHISEFVESQKRYAPYGEGNPPIIVRIRNVSVQSYRRIGDGSHFLIEGDCTTLMGFGLAKRYETEDNFPKTLDCVGKLSEHWFNGQCSYQMELMDYEVS